MSTSCYEYSRHLHERNGYLYCENVRIKDIQVNAAQTLTNIATSPAFIYSKAQIVENIRSYTDALTKHGLLYKLGYSIKANYNPEILRIANDAGCMAVTVSGNELLLALEIGFKPQNILLNGNGKDSWEVDLAIKNGCLLNVDSISDLKHIIESARKLTQEDHPIPVLFRLNPDIDPQVHKFLATGLASSKFGIEECQLPEALQLLTRQSSVQLVGLHCHLGSTITKVEVFQECVSVMLSLLEEVRRAGIFTVRYLNVGGGLGIDYKFHEHRTSRNLPATPLPIVPTPAELIGTIKDSLLDADVCLVLEPGRSLIGNAAILGTKVLSCKRNGDTNYIVVDGAMTEVIRPALYGAYHHIELSEPSLDQSSKDRELFDVVGPVCECGDFIGKQRLLRRPHEGCGMAVFDVGAYCSSMSSNYNMRLRPAEILVSGDSWKLIRRADTLNDLLLPFKI